MNPVVKRQLEKMLDDLEKISLIDPRDLEFDSEQNEHLEEAIEALRNLLEGS